MLMPQTSNTDYFQKLIISLGVAVCLHERENSPSMNER